MYKHAAGVMSDGCIRKIRRRLKVNLGNGHEDGESQIQKELDADWATVWLDGSRMDFVVEVVQPKSFRDQKEEM